MVRRLFFALGLLFFVLSGQAQAQVKEFAVTPFKVNGPDQYKYMSQGIQDMLISRLHWKDKLLPVDKEELRNLSLQPESAKEADQARQTLDTDYLVWGSVTITGDQSSLDLMVNGKDTSWSHSTQTALSNLIPALDSVAKDIGAEMLGMPKPSQQVVKEDKKEQVQRISPALVYNERNSNQEFFLNPEFRYAGDSRESTQVRTQRLDFSAIGMTIADADNDGVEDIFILEDHSLHVYHFYQNALKEVAAHDIFRGDKCLNVRVLDINRDGFAEIFISIADDKKSTPRSQVLNLKNNRLVLVEDRIPFFFNVVRMPPDFMPTLVGQRQGAPGIFKGPVHEVIKTGGEYQLGKALNLPPKANVFNFVYLPFQDNFKLIVLNDEERLQVYTPTGDLQHQTDEVYSGTSIGLETDSQLPGMGKDPLLMESFYYIPMRMLPIDLERDKRYELLVNRPLSVAAILFERYRNYPQGEIHSLFWDGIGLNLQWKTRRIKGTVADFDVKDITGNGNPDLVVCVNTGTGDLGLERPKSMLVVYPLDLSTLSTESPVSPEVDQ